MRVRTLLAGILAAVMLLSIAGCTPQTPTPTPTPSPSASPALQEPQTPTPSLAPVQEEPALTPAQITALEAMLPIFDAYISVFEAMPPEMRYIRNTQDPDFFWNVLFLLCTNAGDTFPGVEVINDLQYKIPTATMQALAAACFFDYTTLLEIPQQTFPIVYDSGADAYFVDITDSGDVFCQPLAYSLDTDGSPLAKVGLFFYSEENVTPLLTVYTFTLSAQASDDGLFQYTVSGVTESYESLGFVEGISEKDGALYALIAPARRIWHTADQLDETGAPYGNDFVEWQRIETAPLEVRISPDATFAFEQFDELFPDVSMVNVATDSYNFFVKNAILQTPEGEPLLFDLNIYEGVLYGGAFAYDYYFAG